jgi:hypothetical protein
VKRLLRAHLRSLSQSWRAIDTTRARLAAPDQLHSYYPDMPRKPKWRITADHLLWAVRYREVHRFYFTHGLDRIGADSSTSLPYNGSLKLVGARNFGPTTRTKYNYVGVLRDKALFGIFGEAMGHRVPRNVALLRGDTLLSLPGRTPAPLSELEALTGLDGFLKPLDGRQGRQVHRLRLEGGELLLDGEVTDCSALSMMLTVPFLLQERLSQHPRLAALHAPSVNTLRLVTMRAPDGFSVEPFAAALRIGAHGSTIDNWAAGGVIVGVDLSAACTIGPGFFKPGRGTLRMHHPDSGIALDGYALPFVHDAVEAAVRFHQDLPGLHTVGWDIALTPTGPVMIEGNEYWDTAIHMTTDPSFVARFRAIYL